MWYFPLLRQGYGKYMMYMNTTRWITLIVLHFALLGRYLSPKWLFVPSNTDTTRLFILQLNSLLFDSQLVLGAANAHVDAVVLYKDTYMHATLHRLLSEHVCTACLITFLMLQPRGIYHFLAYSEAETILTKWPSGSMCGRFLPTIQSTFALPAWKDVSPPIK